MSYLGIDIGGSWIKACMAGDEQFSGNKLSKQEIHKVVSPLHPKARVEDLIGSLNKLINQFDIGVQQIQAIGISTAGIVNYHGTKILKASEHLNLLKSESWKKELEASLNCQASLINDADASAIGLAQQGYLTGNKTIGIMPIGTGLGFSVWRNGRRWRPGKSIPLLGSISYPSEDYNSLASASKLAAIDQEANLVKVLYDTEYSDACEKYIQNLAQIINTAAIIYQLDEVILCGGLANAAFEREQNFDVKLNQALNNHPPELDQAIHVKIAREGNKLQLIGALCLAHGEYEAAKNTSSFSYEKINTEIPADPDFHPENMNSKEIIDTLWKAEQKAGESLKNSIPIISEIADKATEKIKQGGRIIYVGAGTSGRLAAMDNVEIPCTYGFPEDRILSLIPGGIADAAIEIEADFEEDASSIPEMLLLKLQSNDVVIGITASGSAYYVLSALSYAKSQNALSILIQVDETQSKPEYCDYIIPLQSGNEVIAGSTRMKAGTATKKVLNFLSSCIMIKLGKVRGPYMIDVACLNNKLVGRALKIMKLFFGLNEEDALNILQKNGMDLKQSLSYILENKTIDY